MKKISTFQYSDVVQDRPHEKRMPGTITAQRGKGQMSNPLKYMDVPLETRQALRRKNAKELARDMERVGGATTPKGRAYAAVLEERGINPNLARGDVNMARNTPNDMFKRAMYDAFYHELTKLSAETPAPPNKEELTEREDRLRYLGVTAAPGVGVGTLGGGAVGLAAGSGFGGKGALVGGALGAGLGSGLGWKAIKEAPNAPGFDAARRHGETV
jgi:hypothetical protein